jgi:hypothetical protein
MRARLVMIAALTLATSASAEPAKKTPAESAQASARPTVVLAAAEQGANAGSNEQSTPAPAKRPRAARVSSCRCGDPQTQPQDE